MIGILIGGYLLLLVGVNTDACQTWLANLVSTQFSDYVKAPTRVERVKVGLFNEVTLHDVQLDDPEKQSVLRGKYVNARIDLLSLLMDKRVNFTTIALLDTDIKLRKRDDGKLNIQYLIDAFSNPNDTTPSKLNLAAGAVIMRRCQLDYQQWKLSDIDLNVSLRHLTNDSLSLRVRHCGFREARGLTLREMTAQIEGGKQDLRLKNLTIRLQNSSINLPALYGHWDTPEYWRIPAKLLSGNVRPARLEAVLNAEEFSPYLPKDIQLGDHKLSLAANVEMAQQRIRVSHLEINDDQKDVALVASGDVHIVDLKPHDGSLNLQSLQLNMPALRQLANIFSAKPLPAFLDNLGRVNASGQARMLTPQTATMAMSVGSKVGNVIVDGKLDGKVVTLRSMSGTVKPDQLMPGKSLPSLVDFGVNGSCTLDARMATAAIDIKHLLWQGRDYSNIEANGSLRGNDVALHLTSNNPYSALMLNAQGDRNLRNLKVSSDVAHWSALLPDNIKEIAGHLEADLHDILTKEPTGSLHLTDFAATTMQGDSISQQSMKSLSLYSKKMDREGVYVNLSSDFMKAQFNGQLDLAAMKASVLRILNRQIPDLVVPKATEESRGRWNFAINIHNDELLQALFKLPVKLERPLSAEGYVDGTNLQASLQLDAPAISVFGNKLKQTRLYAACNNEGMESLLQTSKDFGSKNLKFNLDARTLDGKIHTTLNWLEPSARSYYGTVACVSTLGRSENNKQTLLAEFQPTRFSVNDTLWDVRGGSLYLADKHVQINRCEIANGNLQGLCVDGGYSSNSNDSITATLRSLDVKYILDLVGFNAVIFEGKASGTAVLKMNEGAPHANFDFTLPNLYFNHCDLGDTHIVGHFDPKLKRINLHADMADGTRPQLEANGYVSIAEKSLDLHFNAVQIPISFINHFVTGILDDVQGRATGYFHLYGPFKKLDFGGDLNAEAELTIPVTGVRYAITSGRARFTPGVMEFVDGKFTDKQGGYGTVKGQILHNHIKEMRYHFEADVDHALVYDMPQQIDWNFYSTARGNGHVELNGRPGYLQADINLTPTRGTDFTFINDTPETIASVSHVRFGSKRETRADATIADEGLTLTPEVTNKTAAPSAMDIVLNMNINVNPDAALHIIMDEKCGDVINLFGRGVVNASWYNKGDFKMYGTCTVDHGEYRFSIQDIIRKNFQLQEGGEVIFAGDPMDANLDVQAVYTVNSASLADLNAGASFADNNVRVNCLLNVRGSLNDLQFSFDLDLPTVNEDEKQMVRKLIATEEDMNMQIIYLLGVGRFYTFDAASMSDGGTNQLATNSVNSFISNTLSTQLNEILGNALQSNNWTFGANLATGNQGWNDMEVEALLSGRLFNNRLLLNGQFGYRDKATVATSTNFIGDFDIQYLLTKNGNVRLKAYSETNDRYFTKSALSTQGIGIKLQKDFGRLEDEVKKGRKQRKTKTKR